MSKDDHWLNNSVVSWIARGPGFESWSGHNFFLPCDIVKKQLAYLSRGIFTFLLEREANKTLQKLYPIVKNFGNTQKYTHLPYITHCILVHSSIVICWMSPFVILGVLGLTVCFVALFYF